MNDLKTETEQFDRLRLKLGINRALASGDNWDYLSMLLNRFRAHPREAVESVLGEMEKEGLLTRVTRQKGGVVIVRCANGVPLNPGVIVRDAVPNVQVKNRAHNRTENGVTAMFGNARFERRR